MNAKSTGVLITAILLSLFVNAQKENDVKDLLGLFNGEQKWMLPAVDSSLCIIRQEYTLIDSSGNEFGADGKPHWGVKYGLCVITDSGVYSLRTILSPWAGDKDLEAIKRTDPRRLQPHLSRRLYKRPADKGFEQWKSERVAGDSAVTAGRMDSAHAPAEIQTKEKERKKNKKGLPDTELLPDMPPHSLIQKPKEETRTVQQTPGTRFSQDSLLVNFAVPDSVASVPVDADGKDTTGWLVLVNGRFTGAVSDTSQLVYTVIKPSYLTTGTAAKIYIRKPGAINQNNLGGIYYTASFSCGKIIFSAAGLLNQDERGWFIHPLTARKVEMPVKHTTTITPIKAN